MTSIKKLTRHGQPVIDEGRLIGWLKVNTLVAHVEGNTIRYTWRNNERRGKNKYASDIDIVLERHRTLFDGHELWYLTTGDAEHLHLITGYTPYEGDEIDLSDLLNQY